VGKNSDFNPKTTSGISPYLFNTFHCKQQCIDMYMYSVSAKHNVTRKAVCVPKNEKTWLTSQY